MKNIENKWVKITVVGIVLILFYKLTDSYSSVLSFFDSATALFLPLIVGVVIAFFTNRPCLSIERRLLLSGHSFIKRHARALGVLSVYLIFIAVIAFAAVFLFPRLYQNVRELAINLPKFYQTFNDFIARNDFLSSYVSTDKIGNYLMNMVNTENMKWWFGIIGSIANSFMTIFVSIIISIYLNLEKEQIFSFFRLVRNKFFKGKGISVAIDYGRKIINVFYSYLSSMLIDAVIVGAISAIVLAIFRVPYSVLLGVLVAVGNMIPFFGAFISAIVISIISLVSLGPVKALWILVFQLVLGQLDGNLLQPRILSSSTGISPLLVLLSVLIFGNLFGVVGMIIGVPVCAAIKMIALDYLDNGMLDGSYKK